MKVVILIGNFGRGGAERQSFLLARELRTRHAVNVEVWALTTDGEYSDDFEAAGIPTRALGFRLPGCPIRPVRFYYWVSRLWHIARALRNAHVDVLLPYTVWPNVVAGLTYRIAGIPLCIWGERSAGTERMPGTGRFAVRQCRKFIANSTAGVEFLVNSLGVDPARVELIPNGIEDVKTGHLAIDWRSSLGLQPGQLLVVKVSNLTAYKDHATLLRAWHLVQQEWHDGSKPILALAGYFGDAYEQCQRLVAERGLESTVRFLGGIPDVPALLDACDLAAFSSLKEGMPNAVQECMLAGKSIVASDLPGVRDALGPNAGDILFPPGDAEACARKLLALMRDQRIRVSLGNANRERIRTEFSVQRLAERYIEVIGQNQSCAVSGVSRGRFAAKQKTPAIRELGS